MAEKFIERSSYEFDKMKVGDIKRIKLDNESPFIRTRALCAAYAFARRSGAGKNRVKFAGRTVEAKGKKTLEIRRLK